MSRADKLMKQAFRARNIRPGRLRMVERGSGVAGQEVGN